MTQVSESEPQATPRPWTAPTIGDIPTPPVVRRIDRNEQNRRRTRFVAEFLNVRGEPENAHANAALAVEAVNNYDRLVRIEEAAREYTEADDALGDLAEAVSMTDGEWPDRDSPEWEPIRAAQRRETAAYIALREALEDSHVGK